MGVGVHGVLLMGGVVMRSHHRVFDWVVGWLVAWLVGQSPTSCLLNGCLSCSLVACFSGWLVVCPVVIGPSVGGPLGWFDWLVGP